MIKLFVTLLFLIVAFGELSATEIDSLKWHLNPNGQQILIEQDDLHSEYMTVNSGLDMGFKDLSTIKLKKKVKVAIVDSGIDFNHPDLKDMMAYNKSECLEGNIFPSTESDSDGNGKKGDCLGWNFNDESNDVEDTDGHGTHVAGLIADFFTHAQSHLEILPLRIFSDEKDRPLPIKMGEALEYAIKEKVDLIHMSMGWPESLMSVKLQKLIEKALDQGIMIVAAAGNSSQRANIYPCKIEGVLCVGALRANGKKAPFSNYGPQVDFMLPGERVLATIPKALNPVSLPIKGYDYKSGTSQAAPLLSGAILFMQAAQPELDNLELKEKLFQSSKPNRFAKRGVVNVLKALKTKVEKKIIPSLKKLNTVSNGLFAIELHNSYETALTSSTEVSCEGKLLFSNSITLNPSEKELIDLNYESEKLEFECLLSIANTSYNFILRKLNKINSKENKFIIEEKNIIRPTRKGVRSRLISIPVKDGYKRAPFYYLAADKNFTFFHLNKKVGTIEIAENCKRLRLLQIDLNQDGDMDVLLEELCDKKFLRYSFFDRNLNELYPKTKFEPKLSVINYNEFEYNLKNNQPHLMYINSGFVPASNDPWNPAPTGRDIHVYELNTTMSNGEIVFKENVLDNKKLWAKQLGLRITPNFVILNLKDNKILFKHNLNTYWFNLKTQTVQQSGLSQLLIAGDEIENVLGSQNEYGVNTLITPYEFRSFISTGISLRFFQEDYYDPFMNVVAIQKTVDGYSAYIKSYINMHKLDFDFMGNFISKEVFTIERFDFLNGNELDALLIPILSNGELKFLVDGTKIHTNYLDIISNKRLSYELPQGCASQMPVEIDGVQNLVFACFEDGKALLKTYSVQNL